MSLHAFNSLVHAMLRQTGMPVPAGDAHEVYTLHFSGEADVHVFYRAPHRMVEVVCEAGQLDPRGDCAPLMSLLSLTGCDGRPPVGVTLDQLSGTEVVWSCTPLADTDVPALLRLMKEVRLKTGMARRSVDHARAPASKCPPATSTGASTLSRLRALGQRAAG